jgi:Domain of unknown function (DUF1963)
VLGDVGEMLRAQGLARVADALVGHAREAITISTRLVDEDALVVGASKVGGLPDLPPEVAWPEERGYPLSFVAQLQMAEVAPYDREHVLPVHGLLSFFWGSVLEPDENVMDWAVLYTEDLGSLVQQHPPRTLVDWQHYNTCALSFATKQTLPPEYAAVVRALHLTERERCAYIDLLLGLGDGQRTFDRAMHPEHRILGYPYELEPGVVEECYLQAVGRSFDEWSEAFNAGDALRQARLEEEASNWRLLLQLDSDSQAGMDWEGGGLIYFCIAQQDLRERAFANVQSTIQFL